MKKLNKKGFTLTELIVVIAVIAILAAVLIPTLTGYIEKARVSADNQEVAVLNKLLLGAEIDEIKFENVPQLKKYLEDEMDYDGDYSLSVKGSYLFFDKEKYEFVIVNENDVVGLKDVATGYKLATSLASPEGLLIDDAGNEILLVGGKGVLVEVVSEIRNLGNTGVLNSYDDLEDGTVKNLFKQLFASYDFKGSKSTYQVDENGNVSESTGNKPIMDVDGSKTVLSLLELREAFHSNVILANLDQINSMMKGEENLNTNEYIAKLICTELTENGNYEVTVDIKQNGVTKVISGVLKAIEYIKEANCVSANIYSSTLTIADYENIVTEVSNYINYIVENGDGSHFEYKYLDESAMELIITQTGIIQQQGTVTLETLSKVDLSLVDLNAELDTKELIQMIKPIIFALNLSKNDDGKIISDTTTIIYNISLIQDKQKVSVIAEINDFVNGNYTVEYVFWFNVNIVN